MAATPVSPNPDTSAIHYQTVSQRMPRRLLDSSTSQRQALRAALAPPLPWLAGASARLPEVAEALQDEYQRHQLHARTVDGFFAGLPEVEAFAEPLLRDALKSSFGLDLDLRRTFLFNAARARVAEAHIASGDPVARAFQVVKASTCSLLQAALQNFEAFETEAGGMQDDRRPASIFISDSGLAAEPSREVELLPERFAALCRSLDLGARYQRLIDATFQPTPLSGQSAEAAASNRQAHFKLFEQSSLRLTLHLARLRGWIEQPLYEELLEEAKNGKAGDRLERSALRLWEVDLEGIVAFFRPGCLVVWLPDEPQQPLQVFSSVQAFHESLRERLQDPAWRRYFLRFVPARQREQLLQRIHQSLYPKVWNPGGWYEERYDGQASLGLSRQAFSAPLLNILLQRKIALLKDDGLFHAVPTAAEDHKSATDKVDYLLGVGFNVLNVAAFVVPGLGELMLAVNAGLLGYEVYEGFDSLAKGEREAAWGYFMDVGENLAIIAALGAAGAAAQPFKGSLPVALRSMRPVTLGDGSVRLWQPDLSPFAYDIRLPAGLQADANGLYAWQGRQWLVLEGRHYSVRSLLGEEPAYVLEHPERPGAYEPVVRHNGNGGWLHELDTPQQWRGQQLFARQGYREAQVSAPMAERALRISGIGEAQLRQALVECRRPPALLSDTLRRLSLAERVGAEAFAEAWQAQQAPLSKPAQALQRQFGGLPHGILEEIAGAATAPERAEMTRTGRVPLPLTEEARIYQQQVRLARAREGLYLNREISLDSARLMLHTLETLPDWPARLRIGLYDGWIEGPRLTGIGQGEEPELGLIWRRQLPDAFCRDLFDCVPAVYRERLGLDDVATLRRKLQEQRLVSLQKQREWLGMQPVKPAFRSPLRLADGRLGLPLSGDGRQFFTEDELLDKLRLLELDFIAPEDALRALYRSGLDRAAVNTRLNQLLDELLQLREPLERWAMASIRENLSPGRQHSRERIGLALWEHWRRGILPELGQPPSRLILSRVQLVDLPEDLPLFFRQRVRSLLLEQVIQQEGTLQEQVIGENRLQALARQFPQLTRLDINAGQWGTGVAQMVARTWPELTALGLRELTGQIGHQDLAALATLPRLRWLDLHGMRLRDMPATALHGLTLDYLGLDWLGLQTWPQWLGNETLRRIGELSLLGNHLSELPAAILRNEELPEAPTRIVLLGNRFGYQALLDLRLAERIHRRFTFELGLSLPVDAELNRRVLERRDLQGALEAWTHDPARGSTSTTAARVAYRQRVTRELLAYWREDLRGDGVTLLSLQDLELNEFPNNLPGFFLARVRRLDLSAFTATPGVLERFVRRFPHLVELSLVDGLRGMTRVPEFLTRLPELRELALVRMGLNINQAAMEAFARMPLLSSLQLDGNRLGPINDMSMFNGRYLGFLGLAQMNIPAWPAWLDTMLPNGIELLNLDDNLLEELPARLLENRRSPTGAVEISLRGNPLTRETMVQAFTSQHYNRPYTFTMDLPEDIASMEREVHSSDSDGEFSEQETPQSEDDNVSLWQTGDAEQDARYLAVWERLAGRGDAAELLGLVGRLRYSADYRTHLTRPELVERVWTVLLAADQDEELRLTLNGMAEEPLQQAHTHETCPDGIRLEFNQMEFQVHTRQALARIGEGDRGPALFRLMRGIFRTQTLDRLARERSNGRDEAEVRLAYRLRWAEQLELPLPPRGMLYRGSANIAAGELNQVLTRLQVEEGGQPLLSFAAQCDFWVAYLREVFAERFMKLKDAYESDVLETLDAYPDDSPEQLAQRVKDLEDKFKADEQALLEGLTFDQALSLPQ